MKLDILAIGAHPDDIELGCGATIAKEISLGKKVGVLDLTRGELGTRGSAEIRDLEAKNAATILGLTVRENLAFADGFFNNDKEHLLKVIEIIRKYQPEIVLCNAIKDRHIDHSKGSKLVSDACFLSGLRKIETLLNNKKQTVWRPKQVYHYIQWKHIKPDFVVDVSNFINIKLKAVKAYSSQFYNPKSDEPASPITSKFFLDSITYRAQDLGRMIGVEYAEGFTAERYIAVKSLDKLI
ncbi:MAG: bacillithiol biosynthesis deacetylase BshB1 [Flavobacteriaceae bacterium]|nr:bacillithiol biosynthesis deacetylase BshB1 [Flavobacteriaceae bacterium]